MAKEWYQKAFNTEPYFNEPFYVGFNIGGYELGIMPEEIPTTDKVEGSVAYWGVKHINEAQQYFIDCGATVDQEPTNVGGETLVASIKDPWGNIIGLIYNPEFELP